MRTLPLHQILPIAGLPAGHSRRRRPRRGSRAERLVGFIPKGVVCLLALLMLAVLTPAPLTAIVPITPPPPILTSVTIDAAPGDQFDPHVSGDWVAYTDDVAIRYYNFATNIDAMIPMDGAARDLLSDVSGSKIVFSRVIVGVGTAVMVFDAATAAAPIEIDPAPGTTTRIGAAIGGNTVAYIDFGLQANGELVISDLSTSISTRITNDTAIDGNPSVSPDGNVVVWEHCGASLTNCDIYQAVRIGGIWNAGVVSDTLSPEANPDTNGTLVVYDSQRGTNPDIFWRSVAGGGETPLELPGLEGNPSIAGQYIAFEGRASLLDAADIFVYDSVNNLRYQITDTPLVNEQLNDIAVLPDGRLRMVWTSDEDGFDTRNIKGATFRLATNYHATIQPPINANGSSVFNAKRGVVPVKFTLASNGTPTCQLPAATISVTRTAGGTLGAINETDFTQPSDAGANFRIDTGSCQYVYNLGTSSFGAGTYMVQINIGGGAVGSGAFLLK